jgi:hypothetical protein
MVRTKHRMKRTTKPNNNNGGNGQSNKDNKVNPKEDMTNRFLDALIDMDGLNPYDLTDPERMLHSRVETKPEDGNGKELVKPEYIAMEVIPQLLRSMGEGKTLSATAKDLGIGIGTFQYWRTKYSELEEAVRVGQDLAKAWWEEQGRLSLWYPAGIKFNVSVWTMMMTNRFGYKTAITKEESEQKVDITKREVSLKRITYDISDTAGILRILSDAGAIPELSEFPASEEAIVVTEVDGVHTPPPDA